MKLNEAKPYLETFGQLAEQSFSVQDQGMMFEILRNKMYSNPILAICREISCNARDAHREVGKANVPVEIHLPNNLEPFYSIKDFGPGISPDRMSNVFIKYTASTKRSDNVQTGGFGLGAKTPFSYSDAFNIITVHNGVEYNYSCVIDETKVGKLLLTSESPTTASNGTEIVIPVVPKNFNDFHIYTEQACRHWEVKPVIVNGKIHFEQLSPVLEGKNWSIISSNYGSRDIKLIIDGIEYPLDITALRNYADTKLIDAAAGSIVMSFGVGELSLSASRESVYLDEKTQKIIRARLEEIRNELKQKAVEKLDSFSNLWEANIYYNTELRGSFNNIDFLGPLTWKGMALTKYHLYVDSELYIFTKGGKYNRNYGKFDANKIYRDKGHYVEFMKNTALFFNDLGIKEPTPRHVKKAWDTSIHMKHVYVINPGVHLDKDAAYKKYNLEALGCQLLSSVTKATGRKYTPPAQRVLVFKFDSRAVAFRQTSYASLDEDNTKKVLCTLKRDSNNGIRFAMLKNGETLQFNALKTLMTRYSDHSFYGVDEGIDPKRLTEDFSDFVELETFFTDKVFKDKIDYVKIKYAQTNSRKVDFQLMNEHKKLSKIITDPNSLYHKKIALDLELSQISKMDTGLLNIYETVNGSIKEDKLKVFVKENPEMDIDLMNQQFTKKYPLITHIYSYNYSNCVNDIAHYINLLDKESNNV